MHIGKSIRMERIFNRNTKRCIIVPMDHGVSVGPIPGLIDARNAVAEVSEGGADAVLMHKGLPRCSHRHSGRDIGLIVHLSASSDLGTSSNSKVIVASVEDALKMGADGISIHVNMGDVAEGAMLADFGRISSEAANWGMPLLAMIYARGPKIKDPFDPAVVAHCARVAMELGADIVKVPYCGDIASFRHVVESCCIPVVIAGGEKMDSTRDFLQVVYDSIQAGGAGLSVGRNVFQHPNPRVLVSALSGIVHSNWSVEEALKVMGEK